MRKHFKRKHRPLLTDPVGFVAEGAAITSQAMLDKLRIRDLAAIETFVKGNAGLQEWCDINTVQCVAETMAIGGIGPEALAACQAAEQVLRECARQFEDRQTMILRADGIKAFRELYEYHDLQRTSISRAEYERWIQKAANRVKSKGKGVVTL